MGKFKQKPQHLTFVGQILWFFYQKSGSLTVLHR